jgi:ectoine hydroxylase-related dioxygenase (phytanoyl-CoA dioxygenase family)
MALTQAQIEAFWRDGCLVAADAVTPAQLGALRAEIDRWVELSRAHAAPFGEPTIDGRPRFDMGSEHSAEKPALRRINNPSDISPAYFEAMRHSRMVDMVADLIGPNVKFHHCKINLKLPGSHTEVAWHQDFLYTPHSNDDVVTALLMLDDVTADNGALMVAPGSHREALWSLFDGERFTGAIGEAESRKLKARQAPATGKAGSVCLMHTRLAHGSEANRSSAPRGLYICVYSAADAVPLARNPMPSPNEGLIVRGERVRKARLMEAAIELPEQPKSASFFTVQGQSSAAGPHPQPE